MKANLHINTGRIWIKFTTAHSGTDTETMEGDAKFGFVLTVSEKLTRIEIPTWQWEKLA